MRLLELISDRTVRGSRREPGVAHELGLGAVLTPGVTRTYLADIPKADPSNSGHLRGL
jgi:hypothetical protein